MYFGEAGKIEQFQTSTVLIPDDIDRAIEEP